MSIIQTDAHKVQAFKKEKIETTYEYVPILGEVLGFWRKSHCAKAGEDVELHIRTPLSEYDRLYVNGKLIKVDTK